MYTRTWTADEVIAEIAKILRESDGEFIEEIAQKVFPSKIHYDGDSIFTQEVEE